MKRYGHLLENWQAAKAEMWDILTQCAREGRTITYSELSALIQSAHLPPYSYGMSGMLTEISRQCADMGKTTLATLVVRKSDGLPGGGYFGGIPTDDIEAYWQAQFARVCQEWDEEA